MPDDFDPTSTDDPEFAAACSRAEQIAFRLIARAEQHSRGLSNKLISRGCDINAVKTVISSLNEQNILNDQRYAELWIRSRLSGGRAQSPQRLQISLSNRGIDRNSLKNALEKVLETDVEYSMLLQYIKKYDCSGEDEFFSLRSHLKHEGFSPEVLDRYFDDQ